MTVCMLDPDQKPHSAPRPRTTLRGTHLLFIINNNRHSETGEPRLSLSLPLSLALFSSRISSILSLTTFCRRIRISVSGKHVCASCNLPPTCSERERWGECVKITVQTLRNPKRRRVSEAREARRGEHKHTFPRLRVPEETMFWSLSYTQACARWNKCLNTNCSVQNKLK